MSKRIILIVDGQNIFIRAYMSDPSLTSNGDHIGGTKGFIKSLQKFAKNMKPDKIVVVWDGIGGSLRRKQLYKEYKDGRKIARFNRFYDHEQVDEKREKDNRVYQQALIKVLLDSLPVKQIQIEHVEADDVIAFVANCSSYQNDIKIIASSDKDFMQLCSNKVLLYRPKEDKFWSHEDVIEEYGIHPNNMALAKAMVGDKSDNINGISGVGFKTAIKRFPFLVESKAYSVSDLVQHAKENIKSIPFYQKIIDNEKHVLDNNALMQLYVPLISSEGISRIMSVLKSDYSYNKTEFIKGTIELGFGEIDFSHLYDCMMKIYMLGN